MARIKQADSKFCAPSVSTGHTDVTGNEALKWLLDFSHVYISHPYTEDLAVVLGGRHMDLFPWGELGDGLEG